MEGIQKLEYSWIYQKHLIEWTMKLFLYNWETIEFAIEFCNLYIHILRTGDSITEIIYGDGELSQRYKSEIRNVN